MHKYQLFYDYPSLLYFKGKNYLVVYAYYSVFYSVSMGLDFFYYKGLSSWKLS